MITILSKFLLLILGTLSVTVSARNLRLGDTQRELAPAKDNVHLSVRFSAKKNGRYSHQPQWSIERVDGNTVAESAKVKFQKNRSAQDITLPGGGLYYFRVTNAADDEITEEDAEAIGFELVLTDDDGTETSLTGEWISGGSIGEFEVENSKLQKFTIMPREFSVDTSALTATLELKRSVVDSMYSDMIERMYEGSYVYNAVP